MHCSPTGHHGTRNNLAWRSPSLPTPWPANHAELCFACAMPVTDQDAALAAVATLEKLSPDQADALTSINAIRDNGEPFVDIQELLALFNVLYFRKLLLPRVQVVWSPRLTLVGLLCASQIAFCDRLIHHV